MRISALAKGQKSSVRVCTGVREMRGASKDQAGIREELLCRVYRALLCTPKVPGFVSLVPRAREQGRDVT